jgi:uncharacterized metal-binding protein YceD (DUF177 family)
MFSSSEFHKDFSAWVFSTQEISIHGLEITRELSIEALNALIKEPHDDVFSWRSESPALIQFNLIRENNTTYKLICSGELCLFCPCIRCLEPAHYTLKSNFELSLFHQENLPQSPFEGDNALGDDEKDHAVSYFYNHTIDLALILREHIFLEIPDYPHCDATCKPAQALLDSTMSTRENPFVKLLKTN